MSDCGKFPTRRNGLGQDRPLFVGQPLLEALGSLGVNDWKVAHQSGELADDPVIRDAELAECGFTRDQARATLSGPDFPWGELDAELARGEVLDEIARRNGMTIEEVRRLRHQLQDPGAS